MTMKLLFTALVCLLLCGCTPRPEIAPPPTEPVAEAPAPRSTSYGSAVTAFSLPVKNVRQFLPFGDGFLLKAERTLCLLDSSFLLLSHWEPEFDPLIRVCGEIVTAFDPGSGELLLLDSSLCELRRITLPADIHGEPILSDDSSILYYCTRRGVYGWDLGSGIRRRIRDIAGAELLPVALHGPVLQCRTADNRDLFLDTADGQLLKELDGPVSLFTEDDSYYCRFDSGSVENLIFGTGEDSPMALFPDNLNARGYFLVGQHAAVTVTSPADGKTKLDLYSLDTGCLRDTLILEAGHTPTAIVSSKDSVLLLTSSDLLLKWQPDAPPVSGKSHTDTYYTADAPDHAGLAQCRDYAQQLSETYGVEVLIWKDAVAQEPWDYRFEAEHRYPVILQQLQTLESCLAQFPESVLRDTAAHFDILRICLVGCIRPITESSGPAEPTGIQFFDENSASIVLAAGDHARQALYHELFHVMETHILSHSNALDRWNELNPSGFSYDLDHSANARRNSGVYLEKEQRAFVDTYSMSFPKEDRARIFEYAMLEDMDHLFRPKTMQQKLSAICTGIREAYGLKKQEEALPWEQYLK